MKFQAVRRATAPEIIVEQILESLKKGDLKPGDQLPPERQLSKMFKVGRSSIREAIRALVLMGYLEVIQGKGAFLREDMPDSEPSTDRLSEAMNAVGAISLMEVREILESKSVRWAAERADARDMAALKEAVEAIEESAGDFETFLDADLAFHISVAEATHNEVLVEMMRLVISKILRGRVAFTGSNTEYRADSARLAREVVEAINRRDPDAASQAMREHLCLMHDDLEKQVSS